MFDQTLAEQRYRDKGLYYARGDRELNGARSEKKLCHESCSRVRAGRYFHSEISECETYY